MKKQNKTKQAVKLHEGKTMYIIFLVMFIALLVVIDQLTKFAAINAKQLQLGFFCLKKAFNYGVSFGLLNINNVFIFALVIAISLAVIFACFAFIFMQVKKQARFNLFVLALCLLLAGTISNLIDRLAFNYVRDFIGFCYFAFPSFNLADLFNVTAVLILVVIWVKTRRETFIYA